MSGEMHAVRLVNADMDTAVSLKALEAQQQLALHGVGIANSEPAHLRLRRRAPHCLEVFEMGISHSYIFDNRLILSPLGRVGI